MKRRKKWHTKKEKREASKKKIEQLIDGEETLYTVEDIAPMLHLKPEYVRRLVRTDNLFAYNLSRTSRPDYRIPRRALEEFLLDSVAGLRRRRKRVEGDKL